MNFEDFEKWCCLREHEFNKYESNSNLEIFIIWVLIILLFVSVSVYKGMESVAIIIFFMGFIIIEYIFQQPLSWKEYLSCLLMRISKEIELYQIEKKGLVRLLKILKRITRYKSKISEEKLFKKEKNMKERFYNSLHTLPERIYYAMNEEKLKNINLCDIRRLAFDIYMDNDEKVSIMDKIINDNPNIEENKSQIKYLRLNKLYQNNWFRLILITIILIIIFYYVIYNWIGIDKNNTFVGFTAIESVAIYVIYKK